MTTLPNCPKCNSAYTYQDANLLICPECTYEWDPQADTNDSEQQRTITMDTSRILERWRATGPGLVMAAAAVGASHLVASTQSGALFGWQLLWLIVVGWSGPF